MQTLGDLRRFLQQHANLPDAAPLLIVDDGDRVGTEAIELGEWIEHGNPDWYVSRDSKEWTQKEPGLEEVTFTKAEPPALLFRMAL